MILANKILKQITHWKQNKVIKRIFVHFPIENVDSFLDIETLDFEDLSSVSSLSLLPDLFLNLELDLRLLPSSRFKDKNIFQFQLKMII